MGDLTANISRHELACECGCGFDECDPNLPVAVQTIVDEAQKLYPTDSRMILHVTSGCRCRAHNRTLDGAAENSKHIFGQAMDFVLEVLFPNGQRKIVPAAIISDIVETRWEGRYGFAMYPSHRCHFDVADRYWRGDYRA